MFLLDTNIVSELRKSKPHGGVLSWIGSIPNESLYISAVSIGEIQAGIEITKEQDPLKAAIFESWLNLVSENYKILPMDSKTFRIWAKLMHRQTNTVAQDAMIAATALEHKLTVVTRNEKDFKRFKLTILNPFKSELSL
jgi:predicted nucleic acid-binding protein